MTEPNLKFERHAGIRAFHQFLAFARLDGELRRVRLTVRETSDERLYYDHVSVRTKSPVLSVDSELPAEGSASSISAGLSSLDIEDALADFKYRDRTPVLVWQENWKLYDQLHEDWKEQVLRALMIVPPCQAIQSNA